MNGSIDANEQATVELGLATRYLTIFSSHELIELIKVRWYINACTERFHRLAIFYHIFRVHFQQRLPTLHNSNQQIANSRHHIGNQVYFKASQYEIT